MNNIPRARRREGRPRKGPADTSVLPRPEAQPSGAKSRDPRSRYLPPDAPAARQLTLQTLTNATTDSRQAAADLAPLPKNPFILPIRRSADAGVRAGRCGSDGAHAADVSDSADVRA